MSQSKSQLIQQLKPYWLGDGVLMAELVWGRIILMYDNLAPASSYDPDDAGLAQALAAATASDAIWMPPGTWTINVSIPASVAIAAMTNNTIFTGQVTLNNYSSIKGITILRTANDANPLTGIVTNATNTCWINDCAIRITQSGSGIAKAIDATGAGATWIWGSILEATSVSGSGYGVYQGAGTVYTSDDGEIHGSTQDIFGTAQLFDFSDEIKLFDSAGANTKIYPPTNAGLAAVVAAIGAGDVLDFPYNIEISATAAVTISTQCVIRNANIKFSGFSGVGLTISAVGTVMLSSRIYFDGTSQASATAIKTTEQCKLFQVDASAYYATTNVGLWLLGTANYARSQAVSCIGDGRYGTTNIGIRMDDYSLAQNCLGYAQTVGVGATIAYGFQFYATLSGEDSGFAMACSGSALGTGGATVANGAKWLSGKYGRAISCSFYAISGGTNTSIVIDLTATAEIGDCIFATSSFAGTVSFLTGDRVKLDNYYFLAPNIITILGGIATLTQVNSILAAQAGTTDDLDTITFGSSAKLAIIQADAGDTITVKNGTGNIYLNGGSDYALSGDKTLLLYFDGTNWSDSSVQSGAGGVIRKTNTITAGATTLNSTYDIVLCNATAGAITVNLPAAASNTGRAYTIKKIDATANAVTVDPNGGETIDDDGTLIIDSQYSSAQIVCDGSEWWIV